jgi:hypothetical protein
VAAGTARCARVGGGRGKIVRDIFLYAAKNS